MMLKLKQAKRAARCLPLLLIALVLAVLPGCGGSDTAGVTAPGPATVSSLAQTTAVEPAPAQNAAPGEDGGGLVPVMPNLSEADVSEVTAAATSAYNKTWGDGSGIDVVWGPNIVSGWAIIGMENISGAAGKDILLQKEGGAWVVRDMGNGLMERWKGKTPAELWSTS